MTELKPPCGSYGDIDNDGYVTATDVMKLADYIDNPISNPLTTDELKRADVDGDGVVTSKDVDLLVKYWAREINTFPVCKTDIMPYVILALTAAGLYYIYTTQKK